MEIDYREHAPSLALAPFVDRYWTFTTGGTVRDVTPEQCCIPLGMSELMMHLRGPHSAGLLHGEWTTFPRVYFTGIALQPLVWTMNGASSMIGARLTPEGMLRLFRLPLDGICDSYADAWPLFDARERAAVEHILRSAGPLEAVQRFERLLLAQLAQLPAVDDRFVQALHRMRAQGHTWDKAAVNDVLFVGDRQMQRLVNARLGLTPKASYKIMRFREAYDRSRAASTVDRIGLATLLGYSDQAHPHPRLQALRRRHPAGLPPAAAAALPTAGGVGKAGGTRAWAPPLAKPQGRALM